MQNTQNASLPAWLQEYHEVNANTAEVFDQLKSLSNDDISNRALEIKRLLRTSGYSDVNNAPSWQLDPLPYLFTENEWQQLSAGLSQRLALLHTVLSDLRGEKRIFFKGLVEPAKLMAHPSYLPESTLFSTPQLLLASFDIVKEKSGQFTVIKDHCQFPSGLGILLENRIIGRRVMSEEFAEYGVQRIAGFFKEIQNAVRRSVPQQRDPNVVILSAGPEDSDYPEHAYLATFMDYTLVRSADLTVRQGNVWLKALDGLRKVDVIVRWIGDDILDSLEQPKYSDLGVPGLFMAVRAGKVALVNGPGTNILQIPALQQALPKIAESLLGVPLLLPQLTTQNYLGEHAPPPPNHSLLHYTDPNWKPSDGNKTPDPTMLYWQRTPDSDTATFWNDNSMQAKDVYFRCFALWHNNNITIMPAALCSSLSPVRGKTIGIKDTWVPATGPHAPDTATQPQLPSEGEDIALIDGLIPSRAAENLYRLGSSLERCENIVRVLRVYIDRFTEVSLYPDETYSQVLTLFQNGILNGTLINPYQHQEAEFAGTLMPHKLVIWESMCSKNQDGALINSMNRVLNSAKQVRELLSYDTLRIIETLDSLSIRLQHLPNTVPLHQLQSLLDKIIAQIMAFNGSIQDSLSLNSGAFMLDIGRRIERSTQLLAMLDTLLTPALSDREQISVLDAVLLTQVSAVTHRRRYRMKQSIETGLELLIVDADYPRSLAYQIDQLISLVSYLPSHVRHGMLTTPNKLLLQLKTQCALAEPSQLIQIEDNKRASLAAVLQSMTTTLTQFKERLQTRYFSHTLPASKLAWSELPAPQETSS